MCDASPAFFFSIQHHEDQINLLLIAKDALAHGGRVDLPTATVTQISYSLRKILWERWANSKRILVVD